MDLQHCLHWLQLEPTHLAVGIQVWIEAYCAVASGEQLH
jgi:hypothetical protein